MKENTSRSEATITRYVQSRGTTTGPLSISLIKKKRKFFENLCNVYVEKTFDLKYKKKK